ncbi:MAG: nucleotidyltransferase family protein [Bacillota bacterium]
MNDWKKTLISPTSSIMTAIKKIDSGALQIALVVENNNRLLGIITDGDIRRGILKGVSLKEPVISIMNSNPVIVSPLENKENILKIMKIKQLHHIPVVDKNGYLIRLETIDGLLKPHMRENIVVLMAGGLGSRLHPLTEDCPKPLLKVGGKPLLETIVENIKDNGFNRFYIAVNYKADMVKDYFGDGSRWGVEINYINERKRMGTAGALSLLPEKPKESFLVMNGDLLTKINFNLLLDFHIENKATATMCVREYGFQVPYGVVLTERHKLTGIEEKPVERFFINAGIYVLEPNVLNLIPRNDYFDMPSIFLTLIKQRYETVAFPIREYWLDIGNMVDFERAKGDYENHFCS